MLPPISDPPGLLFPVKCSFFSYSQFRDIPCLAIDSVFIGRFCDSVTGKIIGAFKKTAQKHKAQQIFISSSLPLKKKERIIEGAIFILCKERLVCCLITRPIIAELKCTSHSSCKVAALRCSKSSSRHTVN